MPARIGPKKPIRLFLAEWRQAKGLTQEQVSQRIGCSSITISRWETSERRPDLDAQAAYAEALGIDVLDFRRHPDQPSADALLRDQPAEVVEQAIKLIHAIRR
jgi:transcriptional regulator with XRE-family HTH domain